MINHSFPDALKRIIIHLKKFPGVGTKTAERFAFSLLERDQTELKDLSNAIKNFQEEIKKCSTCGCLKSANLCTFCNGLARDNNFLCIISSPREAFSIEETQIFKGYYHVLPHLISPIDGKGLEDLNMDLLKKRVEDLRCKEIIIALDSTLEGDTTALYLKTELEKWGLSVTRIAFGLPVGSSLEQIDGYTLAKALTGRRSF